MNICLFVYDFPHRRSVEFLQFLIVMGYKIGLVVGAPYKKLPFKRESVRTKVKGSCQIHPADLARALGVPYVSLDHNDEAIALLKEKYDCNVGIIGGARILKKHIVNMFEFGIINFHPGLIPEVRGLDAVLWALHDNVPFGVSAHIIDHRVDAGKILLRKEINVEDDDTIYDISEKLHICQFNMIKPALEKAKDKSYIVTEFDNGINKPMDYALSLKLRADFNKFKCTGEI